MSIEQEGRPSGAGNGNHPGQQQNPVWNWHDVGPFEKPIPQGVGSEYFTKFYAALSEAFKNTKPDYEIGLIDLSRAVEPSLDFSSVLVSVRLRDQPTLGIAYHVILLAATGEEIAPYTENVGERPVQVYRTPSDAINPALQRKAVQAIQKRWSTKEKPRFVDGTVVQKSFHIEDPTAIQNLAFSAVIAGVTELNSLRTGWTDINLATLNKQGNSVVDIVFKRDQIADAAANTIRSDVQITLSDRKNADGPRDRQLNSGDRSITISEMHGYYDVVWFPVVPQNQPYATFMPQNMAATQKFAPRLIITNLVSAYAQTPAASLLGISTSLSTRAPQTWIQGFKPSLNNGRSEIDLADVGALNIEGNIPVPQANGTTAPDSSGYGKMIDTKSDDFKADHLGLFMNTLFRPELIISIDVPEFGPQTQYLSLFAAAASGSARANDRIIQAANDLTNGEFGRNWQNRNAPIFVGGVERIHAGTWVDKNGTKRDLRDLDYIAVANLVGSPYPTIIRDWSDTFLRVDFPEILRLERRRRLINQFTNDTAEFTGWYQRLTFSAAFLDALNTSIASQQWRVSTRSAASGSDYFNQRGVASFAQQALLGAGNSYMSAGPGYAAAAAPANYGPNLRY